MIEGQGCWSVEDTFLSRKLLPIRGSSLESLKHGVKIASKDFPNLFEIEAVSCYNGEMYIATNVRVKPGVGGDFISIF